MKLKLAVMTVALGFAVSASAADEAMSKDQYKAEKDRIEAHYKQAKQSCDAMSGNKKDVCMKEAKGHEKVATAELDAKQKNTDKARRDAALAKAEAEYDVAKEKCDDSSGNAKDACLKEAKAEYQSTRAEVAKSGATASSGAVGSRGAVPAEGSRGLQ